MQHVVIGTAGHIDHGKTTLIRALTGRETDTLREEKERGISINLGFTYFDLPSGKRAGIVDVPGHEKFIKNMLAGIGGIDFVLLAIAADEGVMPQTREHLNILKLLDIKRGIIAVTKKDMVDNEWLDMVKEDIKSYVKGSFLEGSPMVCVSSVTGEGLDELTKEIDKMAEEIEDKDLTTEFRIPVDRVFSISGFGTVITGTLISGMINEGDICTIYPSGIESKIRGIQVHEKPVPKAFAGQRVAINLSGIKKGDIDRGDVVAKPNSMKNTLMIDVRLNYIKDAPRNLKMRDRVRLYHGTSEILGRVVILDKDELKIGDSGLVQIRLEKELAVRRGDKFIIRSYSPMITVGGGTILEPNPEKHKVNDKSVIEGLLIKEKGDPLDIVEKTIENKSQDFLNLEDIKRLSGKGIENIGDIIKALMDNGKIVSLSKGEAYIHKHYINSIKDKLKNILVEFYLKNPLKAGMQKEEIKSKLFKSNIRQKFYDELLEDLCSEEFEVKGSIIGIKGHEVNFDKKQQIIRDKMLKSFIEFGFQPPKQEDIILSFRGEEKDSRMVFSYLYENGDIVKLSDEIYMHNSFVSKAMELVGNFIKEKGSITAGEFRDISGTSRKYAVPILEYLDGIKFTKRQEDKRILFK